MQEQAKPEVLQISEEEKRRIKREEDKAILEQNELYLEWRERSKFWPKDLDRAVNKGTAKLFSSTEDIELMAMEIERKESLMNTISDFFSDQDNFNS